MFAARKSLGGGGDYPRLPPPHAPFYMFAPVLVQWSDKYVGFFKLRNIHL